VIGLFLPFLQGILFIMLGLFVLSYHSPWAERQLHRIRDRFPHLHERMHQLAARLKTWFRFKVRPHHPHETPEAATVDPPEEKKEG